MDDTTDAESSTAWSDYLQDICEARRIPYSVYSFGNMNEDQIEYTVRHPQQLLNLMKDPHGSEPVPPLRTLRPTIVSLPATLPTEELHEESPRIYRTMDRSGRFAVTQQLGRPTLVWDTWNPMTKGGPSCIGAIVTTRSRVSVVAGVFCRSKSSYPTTLQVVVVLFTNPDEDQPNYRGPNECSLQVHVLDVYPPVPEPLDTLFNERELVRDPDLGMPTVDVQGDILVCFYRGTSCRLVVWDYVEDKVEFANFSEANVHGPALGNELCLRGQDLYLWSHDSGMLRHWVLPNSNDMWTSSVSVIIDGLGNRRIGIPLRKVRPPEAIFTQNPLDKNSCASRLSVRGRGGPLDFTSEFHFPDTQPVHYFGVSVTKHTESSSPRPTRTFILYSIAREPTRIEYNEVFRIHLERCLPFHVIFFGNNIIFWRRNESLPPGKDLEYDVMEDFADAEVDEEGYVEFSPEWFNLSTLLLNQPPTTPTSQQGPQTRHEGIAGQYLPSDLFRIGDLTLQRRGGGVFVYDWPERRLPFGV